MGRMPNKNNKPRRLAFAGTLVALVYLPVAQAATVASPNGRIVFEVDTDAGGAPVYSVRFDDEAVVTDAQLGLRFAAQPGFDTGLEIAGTVRNQGDETWEQPWGERRFVRDHFNELLLFFVTSAEPARQLNLQVRAYDDGVGFRYIVPEQDSLDDLHIVDELTEFRLPLDAEAFWVPGYAWNRYEFVYRQTPLIDVALANTPMTLRLPSGTHISLHEAALVDYAGYVLDQRRDGVFKTNLTPWSDGARVKTTAPFKTPWRTIQVADDAIGLLNSDLVLNLNEPNVLGDVSWVEPGKYVGIWWSMHLGLHTWGSGEKHGATTDRASRYIDFAADNGFDGVLIEGWNTGWDGDWSYNGSIFSFTESYDDFDIEAVTDYAREKGVRLVGHHETSGHISNYEAQLEDAFDLYESVGVRQVKTGYVADGGGLQRVDSNGITHREWHDGQFAVNHFTRVLEEAAERKISINTHEPVKATGLRRTYPNWISREGARGQEYNAGWSEPNPPGHTSMLSFTRMLGGPMDYTPGIFDLTHHGPDSEFRVQTTLMHQLALYVALYSPVQMAADLPENYARFPDAFQFVRDVPTDWEGSVALAGEVGDHVVYARKERGGDDWYLGGISGDEARSLHIPLTFLDAGRPYAATIYRDGDDADWAANPYDYRIEERVLDSSDSLQLKLAAGGGVAVRFHPMPEAGQ